MKYVNISQPDGSILWFPIDCLMKLSPTGKGDVTEIEYYHAGVNARLIEGSIKECSQELYICLENPDESHARFKEIE